MEEYKGTTDKELAKTLKELEEEIAYNEMMNNIMIKSEQRERYHHTIEDDEPGYSY